MYSKMYPIVILAFISLMACNSPKNGHVKNNENTKPIEHQARGTNQAGMDDASRTTEKNAGAPASDPIESFDTDNPGRYPTKLRFASGLVIDVRDIDPYRALPYEKIWEPDDRLERLYELSHLSRSEQDELLSGARINPDALRESEFLRIRNKYPVVEVTDSKVAIAYHATYYSNEEDILATQGYVVIYDSLGHKIREIQDKKDGFYDIRLSTDGKYLMQKYGVDYGEDGGGQLDRGFKFYDTKTGELIFEWELGKDRFLRGYNFFPNTHYVVINRLEINAFEYYLIDVPTNNMYIKTMDLKRYTNDLIYRQTLIPNFEETRDLKDLLRDGFKKIN